MAERSKIDYAKRTLRELAYLAIDSERDYQDTKYGPINGRLDGRHLKISQWEAILIEQMDKLEVETEWDKALNIVRKIAAVCVACMEQHGAPARE